MAPERWILYGRRRLLICAHPQPAGGPPYQSKSHLQGDRAWVDRGALGWLAIGDTASPDGETSTPAAWIFDSS